MNSITTPKGFTAGGILCGIKQGRTKPDVCLVYSEKICSAAAVYTQNLVKGAPIYITKENLTNGMAQAIICNSGNANTCNADGIEKAEEMCKMAAEALNISENDIIVASTGVIGQKINLEPVREKLPLLAKSLSANTGSVAAEAIMTTDTFAKESSCSFILDGKNVTIGGMAKGSGMVCVNMATMLCFLTTDCNISPEMLQKALSAAVDDTLNMVSIDGDTSTNDMCSIMANGLAENNKITNENENFQLFFSSLKNVLNELARMIARDGEGATKLLECTVEGCGTVENAKTIAKNIINSSLVKAAFFGRDANWGRILCAIGYSGAAVDLTKTSVKLSSPAGEIAVCENGFGIDFDETAAKIILTEDTIKITVNLHDGDKQATAYGCDLTYDYVKINGDYRT